MSKIDDFVKEQASFVADGGPYQTEDDLSDTVWQQITDHLVYDSDIIELLVDYLYDPDVSIEAVAENEGLYDYLYERVMETVPDSIRVSSVQSIEQSGGTVEWDFDSDSWRDPTSDGVYGAPYWEVSGVVRDGFGGSTPFIFIVFDNEDNNGYVADLDLAGGGSWERQFSTKAIPCTEEFEYVLATVFRDVVTP